MVIRLHFMTIILYFTRVKYSIMTIILYFTRGAEIQVFGICDVYLVFDIRIMKTGVEQDDGKTKHIAGVCEEKK